MFSKAIERAREGLYEAVDSELPDGTRITYWRGRKLVAGTVEGHDLTHVHVRGVTGACYWVDLDKIVSVLADGESSSG